MLLVVLFVRVVECFCLLVIFLVVLGPSLKKDGAVYPRAGKHLFGHMHKGSHHHFQQQVQNHFAQENLDKIISA